MYSSVVDLQEIQISFKFFLSLFGEEEWYLWQVIQ